MERAEKIELTPEELQVVWVAATQYLVGIMTGETVIITDQAKWVKHLNRAVVKLSRAMDPINSVGDPTIDSSSEATSKRNGGPVS